MKSCTVIRCESENVARGLCGKHYARWRKYGTVELPKRDTSRSPGWGKGKPGGGPYWTKPRILAALKRYAADNPGTLPSSDHLWNEIKKGRLDLPTSQSILAIYHRMNRAWQAAGVERARLKFVDTRWSPAEKQFLVDNAGILKLTEIAKRLGRSYSGVRMQLGSKGMGIKARENQGWLTANRISREYGWDYHRVLDLLNTGVLRGARDTRRRGWKVDPAEVERYARSIRLRSTQAIVVEDDELWLFGIRRFVIRRGVA